MLDNENNEIEFYFCYNISLRNTTEYCIQIQIRIVCICNIEKCSFCFVGHLNLKYIFPLSNSIVHSNP